MSAKQHSDNQRASKQLPKKALSQNLQKSIVEVTKTNPLPFIKKGIDAYINQRKMKKKKKILQIQDHQSGVNKSDTNIKRYDDIYHSIAQIYKHQELRKRILVSPNKILSQQKLLEVFEPYRKEIQKLRIRKNLSEYDNGDAPFAVALKQLGIFYEYESKNQKKMVPTRQLTTNIYRTLPKKQLKEKLKPISESNIKVDPPGGVQFLSVEKIILIDNELKIKQHSLQATLQQNPKRGEQHFIQSQKQILMNNLQRIQQTRRQKQQRLHPQMYIRKMHNTSSNPIDTLKLAHQQSLTKIKPHDKSLSAIMKYYPAFRNNIKNVICKGNTDLNIFSYMKSVTETQRHIAEETESFRVNNQPSNGEYLIGQDDQTEEGFYNADDNQVEPQIQAKKTQQATNSNNSNGISTSFTKDTPNVNMSPGKIQRKKRFFNQLPFETFYYRDLIWKMNYSNNLYIQTPVQYEHRLKAYIGYGNNSSMILGLIKRRIWFAITDKLQQANFVWTQLKQLPYYKRQQPGKQIPVCTPSQLPLQQSPHQYIKSSILTTKDSNEYKSYFQTYINFQQHSDQRLAHRQKSFKYQSMIKSPQIKEQKLQNHLINNYVIGNKKALFNTMTNFYASSKEEVFDYLPLTFHIKDGLEDQSWYKFLKYYYKRNKQIKNQGLQANDKKTQVKQYNAWIVKPGENSNRGNGIQMCLTLQQIKTIVKKRQKYTDGSPKTFIVQSYIEKPLLYQKRKFDIRHYMMITSINGKIKGYFYRDGYVRTTSSEYNLKTNCGKIHLTNDAVQKNLPDYGKYEKGNKISYDELQNYMSKQQKHKRFDFYGKVYPRMKKIATDVMKACSGGIDPEKLVNNFEVFGMDFMVDANYNVWLIEVNTNPCLQLSCPLLGSIIPRMVENCLQLTLDCIFLPPVRYTPKGVHYYKNLEKQNRFELVYDERIEGLSTSSMDVLDAKMLYEEDDTFEDDGDQWKED